MAKLKPEFHIDKNEYLRILDRLFTILIFEVTLKRSWLYGKDYAKSDIAYRFTECSDLVPRSEDLKEPEVS